ncbi:CST complex subunit TEN1 [Asparagus officinalis]|nr:CST complex subunit TEN1 [Asparagus officinalis]
MAPSDIKPGKLVALHELEASSPFFKHGSSLRVTGKLQAHSVETGIAIITDGGVSLKINTKHLTNLSLRIDSIYQFIGELQIQSENDAILQARVGRNVDGIDLNLYYQTMKLRRKFEEEIVRSRTK